MIQRLLSQAFPLMAVTGLLLAGWGLLVTPDEIRGDAQVALWGDKAPSSLSTIPGTLVASAAWRN